MNIANEIIAAAEDMQRIYPLFKSFNQCKQRLPLECLTKLLKELK
jgi:hypothetical protein